MDDEFVKEIKELLALGYEGGNTGILRKNILRLQMIN